ncbi:NitT/TauT family transport system permease protein [Rhodoligotrophos appendicifer]|uniref:ABC transporter permease n=1 Tax=Rhodoligotrophos appendicifer TaxID=987056 RepID=UPI0011869F02|nr:ABC transporter permease [Rhodoligotrophos appendicifer]
MSWRDAFYPFATFVVFILLWAAAVQAFALPEYLVPSPWAVALRIKEDFGILLYHSGVTLAETVGGFVLAVVLGVVMGALLVSSRNLERVVLPVLLVIQTFPKIALAPLIIIWFGLGFGPKLMMSFLVAVFPVLVSTMVGMRSVEKDVVDLARSMQASSLAIFLRFRLPTALPQILGAMKVAVAFAIVGAVVGEWVAADKGLGYLLIWSNANLDTPLLFAILFCLMVIGLGLYYLVEAAEKFALPWHVSQRGQAASFST